MARDGSGAPGAAANPVWMLRRLPTTLSVTRIIWERREAILMISLDVKNEGGQSLDANVRRAILLYRCLALSTPPYVHNNRLNRIPSPQHKIVVHT